MSERARSRDALRRVAPAVVTVVAGAVGLFLSWFTLTWVVLGSIREGIVGADFTGYLAAGRRFIDTGTPYAAVQLAGAYDPWTLPNAGVYLHPPPSLLLVLPFLVLPAVLWWAIPIAIIAWCVWSDRPAVWAWAVILALVAWPRTSGAIMLGNTDLWITAGIALGIRHGWPAAIVVLKPTLVPFMLVGVRRTSLWLVMLGLAAISMVMLPLWVDWLTAIGNGTDLGIAYSLPNLAMPLIPMVSWVGRRRASDHGEHSGSDRAAILGQP